MTRGNDCPREALAAHLTTDPRDENMKQISKKRFQYSLTRWNPQNILLRYDPFFLIPNSGKEAHMNSKRLSARYTFLSFLTVSLFLFIPLTIPQALRAQEVGATLSGSVIDPNGLGIPAAGIAVMNQATGIIVKIVSGYNGDDVYPLLMAGMLSITVHKLG